MKRMKLVATKNPVPMAENPRRFIGADPVEVDMTTYYARRVAHGELVEAPTAAAKTEEAK